MKVVLFIKADKPQTAKVVEYLKTNFDNLTVYKGNTGDVFPKKAFNDFQDVLISYLSPWIIPEAVLKKTRLWNINFHPGPPEYPGIGCFNFALYNGEKTYGVLAHIMEKKVDSGKIIAVKRFPLLKSNSVMDLSIKSYEAMQSLFFEVIDFAMKHKELPKSDEVWKRLPYTRKELEQLCKVELEMTKEEIEKRIKATTYPNMPGAYIELYGYKFEYNQHR